MKAIVYRTYGPPEVLRVEEVRRPEPGMGEVLVRNRASVVSSAECQARAATPAVARLHFGLRRPKWPILGATFSGVVQAVGAGVSRFQVGDDVCGVNVKTFGAHAECLVVREDGVIGLKPRSLDHLETAAVLDGALTALPFLRDHARLQPSESILIIGASGAVGTAAVQLAKQRGATVTAVCSGPNRELVRSLGASRVIDYTQADFASETSRYDVIFDAVGASSFRHSRGALTARGRYLTTVPTLGILAAMATSALRRQRAAIAFTGLAVPSEMARNLAIVAALGESGALRPVIDGLYPMKAAQDAHRRVETGHKVGSVLLGLDAA